MSSSNQNNLIHKCEAVEILDSRGYPTLSCRLTLADGAVGTANVPSGASTGSFEACELRDNQPRYLGKGVQQARNNIEQEIGHFLQTRPFSDQEDLDQALCTLDGTTDKSRLGANAILAVSVAYARACAAAARQPLYQALNPEAVLLPVPMMNVINGGRHAPNTLTIQEFMIVPHGLPTFSEAVRAGAEIGHALGHLVDSNSRGDEGGYAPQMSDPRQALDAVMQAIAQAGYTNKEIGLALDMASSEYWYDGAYFIDKEGKKQKRGDDWVRYIADLVDSYPIVSLEDAAQEEDWSMWQRLTEVLGARVQLVGDDIFVTQPSRLHKGASCQAANAILIKPNQVGTLSEVKTTLQLAKKTGYNTVMSHRSGETEDAMIADLAVAYHTGQIKCGPVKQSDRVAKYNRLLWIEKELGKAAQYAGSLQTKTSAAGV